MKAARARSYTLFYVAAKQGWCVNLYTGSGGAVQKKWLPRDPRREPCFRLPTDRARAEAWVENYLETDRSKSSIKVKKTIIILSRMWLTDIFKEKKYSINTAKRYDSILGNWILDSDYPHTSIQKLDIETELTVPVCKEWINSIPNDKLPNKLYIINTLSAFITHCIKQEWISADYRNPFHKPAIKEMVKGIRDSIDEKASIDVMPLHVLRSIISTPDIPMYRKIRYILIYFGGLRSDEGSGMTWGDVIYEGNVKCLSINKQLLKPGKLPLVRFEEELAKGKDKNEIMNTTQAVISKPKYGSVRIVPAHPELIAFLELWRKEWIKITGFSPKAHHPILILGKVVRGMGHQGGEFAELNHKLIHKDLRASNATFLGGVHSLRRLFSSQLSDASVSDGNIGHLMGHSPKGVLRKHYVSPGIKALAEMVARLPRLSVSRKPDGRSMAAKHKKGALRGDDVHDEHGRADDDDVRRHDHNDGQ